MEADFSWLHHIPSYNVITVFIKPSLSTICSKSNCTLYFMVLVVENGNGIEEPT